MRRYLFCSGSWIKQNCTRHFDLIPFLHDVNIQLPVGFHNWPTEEDMTCYY
uniref:Uncharacterized protein n=1 Tax=Anguilla anguilla TaxID=7936 RepID=A0A0E9WZ28_ANGAN